MLARIGTIFMTFAAVAFCVETMPTLDPRIQDLRLRPPPPSPGNRFATSGLAASFGQRLFFDSRLSGNNSESCAICHVPAKGWGDREPVPSRFPKVKRNSQTIWNVAYFSAFFWDGRADSLWAQALVPLEGADEMDSHRLKIAMLIAQDSYLRTNYEAVFGPLPEFLRRRAERGADASETQYGSHDYWGSAFAAMSEDERDRINQIFAN